MQSGTALTNPKLAPPPVGSSSQKGSHAAKSIMFIVSCEPSHGARHTVHVTWCTSPAEDEYVHLQSERVPVLDICICYARTLKNLSGFGQQVRRAMYSATATI